MHELEMIDKLINVVVDEAGKHNFTKINEVQLKVGRMNGLERHHFESAFTARPDESLKGTKLTIEEILLDQDVGDPEPERRVAPGLERHPEIGVYRRRAEVG